MGKPKRMDQIINILMTYEQTDSIKGTAKRCKVSKNTVRGYLRLAAAQPGTAAAPTATTTGRTSVTGSAASASPPQFGEPSRPASLPALRPRPAAEQAGLGWRFQLVSQDAPLSNRRRRKRKKDQESQAATVAESTGSS